MALTMIEIGLTVECQHHEVATAGQCEIDMKFDSLLAMADHQMKYKYVVKNVAAKHGKTATFMPKPLYGDNGSGMHCHQSIWKAGKPLFADATGYAGLSQMCKWYIGGLLRHAPAILAFAAPTTNSYRRLVPGYEAPVNLAWSLRNRSAACRIPMYSDSPKAKRVEFRCPDPSCNPYLAFAAMLMAGLDGIKNKIDPGDPVDKNIYDLPPEEAAEIKQVPGSLAGQPRGARGRPRVPARGRRVHRRPDRDLHRLQALVGGRPDPPAAAPVRVLPLLRPLIGAGRPACREPAGACSDRRGRSVGCALNNDCGKRIANVLSGREALARAVERPSRLQRHGGAVPQEVAREADVLPPDRRGVRQKGVWHRRAG